MSSDEEDYMSDTFLSRITSHQNEGKGDVRPGLFRSYSAKREHELYKKKELTDQQSKITRPKKRNELEAESRESALSQPISSSNKGFAMMEKLGFKSGMGLGKSNEGRTEPIQIQLKTDRKGLGRAEALKEIYQRKEAKRKERLLKNDSLTNVDKYRSRMSGHATERRAEADLRKSQRICMQLDSDLGITEPDESWFWPEFDKKLKDKTEVDEDQVWHDDSNDRLTCKKKTDDEEEEEEEEEEIIEEFEYTVQEKLEMLTLYLRRSYCYCIWCGTQFDDEKDLQKECPGPTYEEH